MKKTVLHITCTLIGCLGLFVTPAVQSAAEVPESVANARANGMLAKVVYVVFTRAADDAPKDMDPKASMTEHLNYQKKLEKEGIMFAAGPLAAPGIPAVGMIVIRADTLEDAIKIADNDPMHKRGLRQYTIGSWQINEGTMSLRVNFSNGTYEFN